MVYSPAFVCDGHETISGSKIGCVNVYGHGIETLEKSLMDSSPIVRINAIEAIMNSEDEDAVSLIRPSLLDEEDEVKKNALIALYNLCGRDILDEVVSLPSYSEFLKEEARLLIEEYEEADE